MPPPVAFKMVASPAHNKVFPFTDVVTPASTVTVVLAIAVHPFASVIVTVYPDVEPGLTVCEGNMLPLLHEKDVPPEAVSTAEFPGQIVVLGEITGTGGGFTVILMLVVSAQVPLPTMTEYVPDAVGVMEITAVVAPVFHE